MKFFVLILFLLALGAHFLKETSVSKRRALYNQNRYLDHMPENSTPRKKKQFWSNIENWAEIARDILTIIALVFFLLVSLKVVQ